MKDPAQQNKAATKSQHKVLEDMGVYLHLDATYAIANELIRDNILIWKQLDATENQRAFLVRRMLWG